MHSIYLDHQATTPTTASVFNAMKPYWTERFGNPHSGEHVVGMLADRKVFEGKEKISRTLKCEPDEIFFTSGATESNNMAIYALCALSRFYQKKQVIISAIEHKCVIEAARQWTSVFELDLKVLTVDRDGYIDQQQLVQLLRTPTLFCSIIAANNEIGTVQKLDEISKIVNEAGAVFHSDCAQALKTDLSINLTDHVDVASFSGHKIGGPQGIGCIYISADLQEKFAPLILGGGQQNGIRSGTLPLPLCVGLGQAFEDLEKLEFRKIRNVRDTLFYSLKDNISGLGLNGPRLELRHACNLNIFVPNFESSDLIASVQPKLAISSGSACGSGNIEPSHVLGALPTEIEIVKSSIRLSVNEQTTEQDVVAAAEILRDACANL